MVSANPLCFEQLAAGAVTYSTAKDSEMGPTLYSQRLGYSIVADLSEKAVPIPSYFKNLFLTLQPTTLLFMLNQLGRLVGNSFGPATLGKNTLQVSSQCY